MVILKYGDEIQKKPRSMNKYIKELSKVIENSKDGRIHDFFTWHHHQNEGVLQLVDREVHRNKNNRHLGGRAIWGGGSSHR